MTTMTTATMGKRAKNIGTNCTDINEDAPTNAEAAKMFNVTSSGRGRR
jgi:hypothetical protein